MDFPNLSYSEFASLSLSCITTLFSVNIAVFTLTIAFLLNKKEMLKLILKQIQDGGISLSLSNKYNSAREYISKMRYITTVAAIGIISSVLGGLIYLVFLFIPQTYWILIILIPILLSGLCCGVSLFKLLVWYFKNQ